MSYFGKNIKKIRTVKKLSQTAFANIFGLTRASVGAYEEGRSEAKIDTIIQIAKYFSVSVDKLLIKELTVNDIYHIDFLGHKDQMPEDQSIRINPKDITPIVSRRNYQNYLAKRNNSEFIALLPKIVLPERLEIETRAFEKEGCDMEYNNIGIKTGDIVLCSKIDLAQPEDIYSNKIYTIVTSDQIIIRRLMRTGTYFELIADNFYKPPIQVYFSDVLEIWQVQGIYSRQLQTPVSVDRQLTEMENRILKLEEQLKTSTN